MYTTQQILEMLSSDNSYVRYSACLWLHDSIYSSPEIIDGLRKASQDTSQELANCAKAALETDVHKRMAIRMGVIEPEKVVNENIHAYVPLTKKCPLCAETIKKDAVSCPYCGRYIYAVPTIQSDFNSPKPTTEISPQQIPAQNVNEKIDKGSGISRFWWIIVIIVVILGVALVPKIFPEYANEESGEIILIGASLTVIGLISWFLEWKGIVSFVRRGACCLIFPFIGLFIFLYGLVALLFR